MAVSDRELAELVKLHPTQKLDAFKGVKKLPLEEFFTSGHRTCQGCESSLVMKMMVKAGGPWNIVLGSTGWMYVANTTYYSTSWVVPWMHTQLGSSGSAGLGTAAGLKALMRKGKIKDEPINVIAFCGDGGGADMGLSAISPTLTHPDYNVPLPLYYNHSYPNTPPPFPGSTPTPPDYTAHIRSYDTESYANPDIQLSGSPPYGAHPPFSPPGKLKRIMPHRWKKNMAGMMAAGPPPCRYVATVCMSFPVYSMNAVRKALSIGGPTFIHSLDPCPKGWDYDPMLSHELGELAVKTGVWPLYEVEDHVLKLVGKARDIADGRLKRLPVRDYLIKQGRFAHFTDDDFNYFQSNVDEMWEKWALPGVIPFREQLEEDRPPA